MTAPSGSSYVETQAYCLKGHGRGRSQRRFHEWDRYLASRCFLPTRLDLREHGAETGGGVAGERGAAGEFGARCFGAGQAAEVAGELARGEEGGLGV
jgi:hypothetical protein